MKTRKSAFIKSVIALLICLSMLVGTTFAWFTDSVSSSKNIITAGNLDLEMYWTDDLDSNVWYNVEDANYNTIFSYDNWEPGYTDVKYIKLVNNGSLALNYELSITPETAVGKLAEVINVYFAEGGVDLQDRDDLSNLTAIGLLKNVLNGGATADGTLLPAGKNDLIHPSGEVILTFAMNMITSAGNEYMNQTSGEFSVIALATQASFETDFFGKDYDLNAEFPNVIKRKQITANVTPDNGKVPAGGVIMQEGPVNAFVPEGVVLDNGADKLTLTVTPLKKTTSGIIPVQNEVILPVDIHIIGVSENNNVPIIIDLGAILPKYMNLGNYQLVHVEDGVNQVMTVVSNRADLVAHNQFYYDPLTGDVSVAMASFSEVAFYANFSREWTGGEDYTWYTVDRNVTSFEIANADQLYAFAKIVGGMAKNYGQFDFEGCTVTLISDINLNGGSVIDASGIKRIFYPIGYYNSTRDSYEYIYDRAEAEVTGMLGIESGVTAFKGTFDGNGHTVGNFYQNTWDMFGDYNNGYSGTPNYYKDAMGLFGYVKNGTVKNLTVDNFSSDGEFTPTGVIAAYACNSTFENIAITNCNPRVYNTGNGGIVGIGGNDGDTADLVLTFNNITIDNSNVISALWGSWDVACGGLVGMFRGDGEVHMTNCHVAAQIDVYNDVCGNYQYYWYRYSGMLVGTNKNMITENGYTVPETDKFIATNCTVHFGDWNDYYYCELVANSLASYTHDHQMSRLEIIDSIDDIKTGEDWTKAGNFLLIEGDTKTCYHIVNKNGVLTQHTHESMGTEIVDGKEVDVEDKRIVYLQFNQLFTGYGWGVKHVPILDFTVEGNDKKDVTILDRTDNIANSVTKFEANYDLNTDGSFKTISNKEPVTIEKLFSAVDGVDASIALAPDSHVHVTVTRYNEFGSVSGLYTPNNENWADGTVTFNGTGPVIITIQDYKFCTPTVMYLQVIDPENPDEVGGDISEGDSDWGNFWD
ncbi:MAG: hypothetical protein IJA41_04430 [Clostridia bacterium]|nr:hypothetical protein [Clostridia bacterium]